MRKLSYLFMTLSLLCFAVPAFAQGAEATFSTSAEFERLIRDELKQWEFVIREARIKPE